MTKSITFDEADINARALEAGRGAAMATVTRMGIRDLNTMSRDQYDRHLIAFLLAYNGTIAREQFGINADVHAVLDNQDIPF